MVCSWGMSGSMGPQTFGETHELMFLGRDITRTQDYSENTAQKIDAEVNRLLRDAHKRATDIITTHRETMEKIAINLIERETLDGRDVAELMSVGRILTEDERDEADLKKMEESFKTDSAKPTGKKEDTPVAELDKDDGKKTV
jgi:cell division protease FtsH